MSQLYAVFSDMMNTTLRKIQYIFDFAGWCLIPWRVTICINGFFGCMVLYLLRICMSLAIVCMVKSPAVQNTTNNNVTTTASYGYTQTSDATFYVGQSDSSDGCGDVGSKNPTSNVSIDSKQCYFRNSYFDMGAVCALSGKFANL